ncbi:MAG: hypothetical protein IKU90_01355 [Clostridia bacterium]|nr:hypothetical protein [Clostridia bacterium]
MKASLIRKSLLILLATVLCALSLASCKTTLKPGENGLYDDKNKISYSHASTVYEATALVKEYGKLALSSKESYVLYTIPGADPTEILATEDYNIVYAEGVTMPTLVEMAPTVIHVCVDSDTVREVGSVTEVADVISLVQAYTKGESMAYPAAAPLRSYTVRFESTKYTGFFYTLTYVEYATDVEIDGVNYGRYFFRSAFEGIFVPVGDEIHKAMGFED